MTKLVPLNQYQPVIQRDTLDSYLINPHQPLPLDKRIGRYVTDQGNGIAKSMQGFKWMSAAAEKFYIANSFTNSVGTIGREGFSALGLLYAGHCMAEFRGAIENVMKAPTRDRFIELAYAIFELAVSILYALKLFVPVCLPVDMAISVIAPLSELSEFGVGVQQVHDSKTFANWLQTDENDAKDFYRQALVDKRIKSLADSVNMDKQVNTASAEVKGLADAWFAAKADEARKALKAAGCGGTDDEINESLRNRCIVQLKLAADAKEDVTDVQVDEQLLMAREVYGNTGEKQVKGWLQTAKTICSLVNRALTWTLIVLAFTACVVGTAATPIGWTMFAIGGVSIVLSMIRANWAGEQKAPDNMTVDVATNAMNNVGEFKIESTYAAALVV